MPLSKMPMGNLEFRGTISLLTLSLQLRVDSVVGAARSALRKLTRDSKGGQRAEHSSVMKRRISTLPPFSVGGLPLPAPLSRGEGEVGGKMRPHETSSCGGSELSANLPRG